MQWDSKFQQTKGSWASCWWFLKTQVWILTKTAATTAMNQKKQNWRKKKTYIYIVYSEFGSSKSLALKMQEFN